MSYLSPAADEGYDRDHRERHTCRVCKHVVVTAPEAEIPDCPFCGSDADSMSSNLVYVSELEDRDDFDADRWAS